MRKSILLSVLILAASPALLATIRTVSNNPSTIAQFNNIQAAIDASNSGDTVYVHGSPNNYAGFAIASKQLVIMGPGWSPDKNLPHLALVNGSVSLTGAGAAGTEFQGLTFLSSISINSL